MMSDRDDIFKDPLLYIEEFEHQLDEIIHKRKEDIEKNLEARIQKEKSEAQLKIEQIEKEFVGKKEALVDYRTTFSTLKSNKTNIQSHHKEHLEKAIKYLKEIENLTAQSLEELKKAIELDQKLEELAQTATEKAAAFKKDLEEGFEVAMESAEFEELEDTVEPETIKDQKKIKAPQVTRDREEIDLAKEREKLQQIVELLRTKEPPKSKKSLSKKYRKSKK